jgi:hypothetical protein
MLDIFLLPQCSLIIDIKEERANANLSETEGQRHMALVPQLLQLAYE